MIALARTDTSVVGRWWWTVDRWTLAAVVGVIMFGAMLTMAASPPVADRLGIDSFHFARRQLFFFLPLALVATVAVSVLTPQQVRRLAFLVFVGSVVLMALTLVAGPEVKGSRRWLAIGPLTIQPSEFVKPAFAVVAAWLFTRRRLDQIGRASCRERV